MKYPREELRLPTSASANHQSRFSWQLGVYAILVAVAMYYLCIA
jgi:hypothetical protein